MGQTKYSRKTRNKNTLSASMNTPRLGSNACSLCAERSIPENLNAHVNDDQTCADVHLQLSMLRYDNAMCAVGQEKYRDLCCTAKNSSDFKSALGFMIGAVVAGAFLKKIVSRRKRRARQENEYDSDAVPGTVSFSSRSSGSSSRSGRIDLEMPSSHYMKMDESENFKKIKSPKTNRGKKDRYPSRPRDRLDRIQSSPHSRGRHSSRTRDRSRSRSRPRVKPEAYRSNRDRPMSRSRARSISRPRDLPKNSSSNRDRSGCRSRPRSRGRPRDQLERDYSSSRDRSISRNESRGRGRGRGQSIHSRSRSERRRSRSQSRPRSGPEFQGLDPYHVDGIRLPTQVL